MWPVRSARGMKVPGGSRPRFGCSQRLGAGAAAGAQVDVRLVVEHDLAALDGVGQVLLQQPELGDLPVAGLGEPLDPVLPLGLGRVHGDVGAAHQVPGGQLGCRPGQADAGADGDGHAAQPVGDLVGVVGTVKAGEQQGELVATEARRHPAAVSRPAKAGGHLDQQLVPGCVAVDVVDLLEVVEVDDQQGDGVLGGVGGGVKGAGQPLEEERPVGQAGELVVVGAVGQLGVDAAVGVGQRPLGGQRPERVEDVVGDGPHGAGEQEPVGVGGGQPHRPPAAPAAHQPVDRLGAAADLLGAVAVAGVEALDAARRQDRSPDRLGHPGRPLDHDLLAGAPQHQHADTGELGAQLGGGLAGDEADLAGVGAVEEPAAGPGQQGLAGRGRLVADQRQVQGAHQHAHHHDHGEQAEDRAGLPGDVAPERGRGQADGDRERGRHHQGPGRRRLLGAVQRLGDQCAHAGRRWPSGRPGRPRRARSWARPAAAPGTGPAATGR